MAVYLLSNHGTPTWLTANIQQITGPASILVKLSDERILHKHVDDVNVRTTPDLHEAHLDGDTTPDSSTLPAQTVPRMSTRIQRPPNRYI